jgi:hypothetical protein
MFRVLVRWVAALSVYAVAVPVWGCFPTPDAKPRHEISLIDLPLEVPRIAVVYESEGYRLRAPADDLLSELSRSTMAVLSPNDLANALRSKMTLGRDIDARELVVVLSATQDGAREQHPTTMQANEKLRLALATLLQEGKTSVTEISSHRALSQLKLDRFSEICHGGRLFMTSEEQRILRVVDWVS